ncbi:protoporphyrinogen oxidase [Candidatus Francisella endociliophora]|uniref:Protoporphyrinogen oxidase n=1 Tax=Candidatus Francisella endociliophora TaxID=653937 RepID=A0A097ERV9_9GAMM|nr:NAD(P)-binding protein [Francisella sp. FSC1006]AIT10272.1 protoporphyrinogen oxidase [Francisella sp. FSC1006]
MTNMKHINTIIIGGGISGISFAQKLSKANIENVIFEPNKVGGCIDSTSYEDFWFEMGAHTIYNSYSDTIEYIKTNSLEKDIQPRKKLPFLFVQPSNKIESIFTNLNPFTLVFNFIKNRNTSKENKTVSEYAKKVFGKSNYNKTFKYCFNAVLSQNSESFPMEYLFKKYDRDKTLPRSFTLKNGLSELFVNHKQQVIHENVISVAQKENKWIIQTNNTSYSADNLCLATPWYITEELLKDIKPNIAKHNFSPTMSKLTSIGVVIEKADLKQIKSLAGLIGKEQFFYSAVTRDVIEHDKLRAIVFHCHDNISQEELVKKIIELLKISKNDILHTYIKNNSLPCYHRNHSIFLKDLDNELNKDSSLYITGNFFDRLAIENCIRRSNNQANKIIQKSTSII